MMIGFIGFLFGICIGSFLNVVIDRIPNGESIANGRSKCDFCRKTLRWYELIPVFSWIIQRGRCLRCKRSLSIQYPLIEFITGIGFYLIITNLDLSPLGFAAAFVIFSLLFAATVVDFKYELISDIFMFIIFLATFILYFDIYRTFSSFFPYLLSGLGASLFFFLFWAFSKGKAMGFGDVELAFVLGFLAGYPTIIYGLYIAFLTGALIGVILIVRRKKTFKSHVPFGPFLILGTLIAMLYSVQIHALLKGILW
jgi:prepilin signal peptidase PulO-like enzyme (type II secretory pathway)